MHMINRKLLHRIGIALWVISIFTFILNAQSWTFIVPHDTIQKWVKTAIAEHYQAFKNVEFEIEYIRCPERIQLPSEDITYTISNKMNRWRGNVVFTIQIISTGQNRVLKTFTAQAKVKTLETVVMAARTIQKGEQIGEQDIYLSHQETTSLRDGFMRSKDEIVGKIAVQTIRKNQIIYSRYVKKVPIIKKGERIVLMYNQPPLVIKVYAIALQDGSPGEWIWVRNLQSNKRLKAKVVRAGIAEVE